MNGPLQYMYMLKKISRENVSEVRQIMVKVLAQEMKTVGIKNFTVHTCTSVRGRSQYFFATHSVIVTLGGGGGVTSCDVILQEDEAVQSAVSWNARCKLKVYFQSSLVIEQDFLGVYYFNKCIYTVKKELSY